MVRSIEIADGGDVARHRLADDRRLPDPQQLHRGRHPRGRHASRASARSTVSFDVLSDTEKSALQKTLGRGSMPAGALAQVDTSSASARARAASASRR